MSARRCKAPSVHFARWIRLDRCDVESKKLWLFGVGLCRFGFEEGLLVSGFADLDWGKDIIGDWRFIIDTRAGVDMVEIVGCLYRWIIMGKYRTDGVAFAIQIE